MNSRAIRQRQVVLRLLAAALILYLMLRWFESWQVYQPTRELSENGDVLGRAWQDVALITRDGERLHAWFFPADTNSPRSDIAVLLCHGNGGNISHRLDSTGALLETGVNVLLFDYRGYGRSSGRPGEEGTYTDAQTGYAWLRERGFAATNVIALGESLGGGVASELALREPLGGLILQSTFTSIPDIGAELFPFLPVRWLARIHYDTHAKLPRIRVPVAFLHSREDTLISFAHVERNFAVANEPRLLVEIAGDHNDFIEAGREKFVDGVGQFLELLERSRSAKPPSASPTRTAP